MIAHKVSKAIKTMLYTDDEDATLKTPVVRPNDILDIDVSPVTSASSVCRQFTFDCKEKLQKTTSKPKLKGRKTSRDPHSNGGVGLHMGSPMKRGDPFLPSVFPDENPIADYNVKKNSRKKPSDCKCKGSGYNLSPSALLPEEMRQQWGVGMFGKPTVSRANVISSSACCNKRDADAKSVQPSMARAGDGCSSSSCCVLRCKSCMRDPCACSDTYTKADGFRIPEINVTRKQKTSAKAVVSKGKENKNVSSLLLGSTNSVSVLKRVTFYNKDSNNIISTSNFHRNNASSAPGTIHSSSATEMNGYKSGLMASQGSSIRRSINGSLACNTRKLNYSAHEHFTTFPRARHRQQQPPLQSRRHVPSVPSPPILAATGLRVPPSMLENKSPISRSGSQMFMMGNQGCTCDSCRQRANLMSKMEELGFSTSHAQQMLPSFMLEASQRYQSAILRSALSASGRYAPYNVPAYSRYAHPPNSVYCSPERYQSSSPSVYNYSDSPIMKSQTAASTTPLSVAHEANSIDTSYADSSNPVASPPFSGFGEDITDLSIKDTVDFFVSMKSPFVKFSAATPPEAYSVLCSSLSSGEHSVSPRYNSGSNPWYCSAGMCGSSYTMSPVRRENVYNDSYHKVDVSEGQTQPMSLLYSSLVSDLEDELRCAIENIPTT